MQSAAIHYWPSDICVKFHKDIFEMSNNTL